MRNALSCLFVLLLTAAASPAGAGQNASLWAQGMRSSVRLIAGRPAADGAWQAGVEIRLAPGAVTYWRNPGDSGVPPTFTFAASSNLKAASVAYPAPMKLIEGGAEVFGYKDKVIFPVKVVPGDADRPVELVLNLAYAVCEKICIPAQAEARLLMEPGDKGAEAAQIEAAMSRTPATREPGADGDLSLVAVEPDGRDKDGKPAFRILARAPLGAARLELFAEAPAGHFVETGKPDILADGRAAFAAVVVESPKGATGPLPVVFTLVAGDKAVETRLVLDLKPPAP